MVQSPLGVPFNIYIVMVQSPLGVPFNIYIKYNKDQARLGFDNFYSKFSTILGLFQGLPGRLD